MSASEPAAKAPQRRRTVIQAGGALCWRIRRARLEVLLIHRPRYSDWSWPKGKLDDGETLPEAAVREVFEEVGLHIRLGIPLPSINYPVGGGTKHVCYWAAQVRGAEPVADGTEVDKVEWVSPEVALQRLSNPSDREPLEALLQAHREDRLETWPFILVRHAKAKPRSTWTRAEGDRTLAATGRRQAIAMAGLLESWQPQRIVTSPWVRCVQTVAPYVKAAKPKVRTKEPLTEAAHKRNPQKAAAIVEKLFSRHEPVALCTHRPVLPAVLAGLKKHMPRSLADQLPGKDPYLKAGEILVAQVSRNGGRVVSVERHIPFED